jgi:hypothetical protein
MRCFHCRKPIPDDAERCQFCGESTKFTAEEEQIAQQLMDQMDPETVEQFEALLQQCGTADEFVNAVLIGDCPACGSSSTNGCQDDPEIADPSVGRCLDCGQLWCPFCERLLTKAAPSCDCLDEMLADDEPQ